MVEVDIYPYVDEIDIGIDEPGIEEFAGLIDSGLPSTDVGDILDFYETIYEGDSTVAIQLGRSALSEPAATKTSENGTSGDDNDDKNKDSVEWMKKANCRGMHPNTFFPHDGIGVEVAQEYCSGCPVKNECLEYALNNKQEHGIWGGASERERRRIQRRRRLARQTINN